MLIPYLLTFHWMKLLIFVLIVCVTIMRILLKSQRMFFAICLTQPPKNSFLWLTINSINKLILWLWDLHWVQLWLTFLFPVLKINGSKIALMVWSLPFINSMLTTYTYHFPLSFKQKSLKIIYLPNIPT